MTSSTEAGIYFFLRRKVFPVGAFRLDELDTRPLFFVDPTICPRFTDLPVAVRDAFRPDFFGVVFLAVDFLAALRVVAFFVVFFVAFLRPLEGLAVVPLVLSLTVVFGCRFAVPEVTYRPVTAERCLLAELFFAVRFDR